MVRSMLVGLDGSEYSKAALELALCWAKHSESLLVGLGVVDEEALSGAEAVPLGADAFKAQMDQEKLHQARCRVEGVLEQFALQCAQRGVACKELEEVGSAADQILLQAQRYDIIILGQKTFFVLGPDCRPDDTLEEVLKKSPRPVVVVPRHLDAGSAAVAAYDGSLQAARTLQLFALCLGNVAGRVHVISVHPEAVQAARLADRAAEFLRFQGIDHQAHPLATEANPAEVLLQQTGALGAGLLVMGAYGKSFWHEFFLGSVTKTILNQSNLPLFLYH